VTQHNQTRSSSLLSFLLFALSDRGTCGLYFEDEIHLAIVLVPHHATLLQFGFELFDGHLESVSLLLLGSSRLGQKHRQRSGGERGTHRGQLGRFRTGEGQHKKRQNLARVKDCPLMVGIVMGVETKYASLSPLSLFH